MGHHVNIHHESLFSAKLTVFKNLMIEKVCLCNHDLHLYINSNIAMAVLQTMLSEVDSIIAFSSQNLAMQAEKAIGIFDQDVTCKVMQSNMTDTFHSLKSIIYG